MSGTSSGIGDRRGNTDDPWISTAISVSGLLGGFSLASIVAITGASEHFRWPGWVILSLTIASVAFIAVALEARRGSRYYGFTSSWRVGIWVAYHIGIITILLGLGLALAPRDTVDGVVTDQGFRWAAAIIVWLACTAEFLYELVRGIVRLRKKMGHVSQDQTNQ